MTPPPDVPKTTTMRLVRVLTCLICGYACGNTGLCSYYCENDGDAPSIRDPKSLAVRVYQRTDVFLREEPYQP